MNRWAWMFTIIFLCVFSVGCNKRANDQEAIRASIEKRLNGRSDLNLSAMDREVKQVSIDGDHATAQVEFRLKGGDAKMEIEYTLERQGKEWVVLHSQPMTGGSSHTGIDGAPSNAPDAAGSPLPQSIPG